jgi:hypothetical protein
MGLIADAEKFDPNLSAVTDEAMISVDSDHPVGAVDCAFQHRVPLLDLARPDLLGQDNGAIEVGVRGGLPDRFRLVGRA